MIPQCGKEAVASPWASLQPPILGVGRYGESVPLLLPPGGGPHQVRCFPHQPEGKRDSARSGRINFSAPAANAAAPSLITRPTLVGENFNATIIARIFWS
jgi:hypothetical protein